MTWEPAPEVTGGQSVVAKYLRISRLFKQEKAGLSCHPQGLRRPRLPPRVQAGPELRDGTPGCLVWRVSSEDLPALG